MNLTNKFNIQLPIAVWLLHDQYDYVNTPNYISVTKLMRPIRHLILPSRVTEQKADIDISERIATTLGTAIHDSIEKAWLSNPQKALAALGCPEEVISRIRINPTKEELVGLVDAIPVYLEQRTIRPLNGYHIGGKYDMVFDGEVNDYKTTSAYTWVHGGRDDEHQLQGSLYRWLNPDIITKDYIRINYIFTDWNKVTALTNPDYPQCRTQYKDIPLLSIEDTEKWIIDKLNQIEKYKGLPEQEIPECTTQELWQSEPVYKYYSDHTKTTGRSTKNFDSLPEAMNFKSSKGKGIVITVPGEPKRCGYCEAFTVCTQKDKYFHD